MLEPITVVAGFDDFGVMGESILQCRGHSIWSNWQSLDFFNRPPAPLEKIKPINVRQYPDWRKDAPIRANREKAPVLSHLEQGR